MPIAKWQEQLAFLVPGNPKETERLSSVEKGKGWDYPHVLARSLALYMYSAQVPQLGLHD